MLPLLPCLLFVLVLAVASARDAPQNVADFYNAVRAKGSCSDELATGFYSSDSGPSTFSYCGDHLGSSGVIYIQGRDGALANMDVDCDGVGGGPSDDGRCRFNLSKDIQNATAFRDIVANYGKGIKDFNPYVHTYVVFGNAPSTRGRPGWRPFDPTQYNIRPVSIVAVVGPDKRVRFGIWGDTNGDDGAKPMVGEASLSLATMCGGPGVSGGNGIDENEFLYLSFTGDEAVPGANGAKWDAKNADEFEKSLEAMGNRLLERVQAGAATASCFGRGWKATAGAIAAVMARSVFGLQRRGMSQDRLRRI